MPPILSVLVISHNQRCQVQRCLESVLSQKLPFDYEIVISDDASSDGTWELEQEYAARYSFIKIFQCNSNDCNPTITSERSGYNRFNAFSHCCGKYFVHIDADDWYRPDTDCLARQVELLEKHLECSMCMQDEWCWNEGDSLECGHANHALHRFQTGYVLSAEEYFQKDILANNGVMMMRRCYVNEPSFESCKWYVDNYITAFYFQFGPIVCLDRNDWVYTQTPYTITNNIGRNDRMLLWGLDSTVFLASKLPPMKGLVYLSSFSRSMLLDAVRCILEKAPISSKLIAYCEQFEDVFVFKAASKEILSPIDKIRLTFVKFVLKRCRDKSFDCGSGWISLLHALCC